MYNIQKSTDDPNIGRNNTNVFDYDLCQRIFDLNLELAKKSNRHTYLCTCVGDACMVVTASHLVSCHRRSDIETIALISGPNCPSFLPARISINYGLVNNKSIEERVEC